MQARILTQISAGPNFLTGPALFLYIRARPTPRKGDVQTCADLQAGTIGNNGAVLVTHHADEITPSFTHALLMKEGKAYEAGPIHKTLRSKSLSKVFKAPIELKSRKGRFFMKVAPPSRGVL